MKSAMRMECEVIKARRDGIFQEPDRAAQFEN